MSPFLKQHTHNRFNYRQQFMTKEIFTASREDVNTVISQITILLFEKVW